MKNTQIISDCHAPYHHRDTIPFLTAMADYYGMEEAKSVGDLVDNHFSSFHEIEYGTLSAQDEHNRAKKFITQLSELWPEMTVVLGNHDILTTRKAKTVNIPLDHIRSYNEIYGVNWNWVDYEYFKIDKYNNCLIQHAMSTNTLTNATKHSHCSMQGHFHGVYGIEYFADRETLRWSMTTGCLIDPHSPAFSYGKGASSKRPILGAGGIVDNLPILCPMRLTKSGRWNKKIGG